MTAPRQSWVSRLFSRQRNQLLFALVWFAVECLLVLAPVSSAFELSAVADASAMRLAVMAAIVFGAAAWWAAARLHRPIVTVAAARDRGEAIADELTKTAFFAALRLPLRQLLLRTAVWVAWATAVAVILYTRGIWVRERATAFVAMTGMFALVAASLRSMTVSRLMAAVRREWFDRDVTASFVAVSWRAFALIAAWVTSGVMLAQAGFLYFFVPMPHDRFLMLQGMLISIVVIVAALWALLARRHARSLHLFATRLLAGETARTDALAFYRDAQWLPYQLARNSALLWVVAIAAALVANRARHSVALDDAVIIAIAQFMIVLGGILYELLLYRATLSILVVRILARGRVALREVPPSLSLPAKLLYTFGGVVVLACGMATIWGLLQYKSMSTEAVAQQSRLGMAWLRSAVQAELVDDASPPTAAKVRAAVQGLASVSSAEVIYFVPASVSADDAILTLTTSGEPPPALPWYLIASLHAEADHGVRLALAGLDGRAGRMKVRWHDAEYDVGAVAMFYPTYYGRGSLPVRPIKQLFVFFVILLVVCGGVVALSTSQFTNNIRALERRANEMARGSLTEPVLASGEGDEIGSLTLALEEMRRALRDRIRSTEEINFDLERAVQSRTSDLAGKNRQLADALDKLTSTQDQLVRSEKMASIGQLVAGIAHEINNPVNAIVNTVAPLQDVLQDVAQAAPGAAALVEELAAMVRVIERGAQRTKAIVGALHNYSRTDEESIVSFDLNRSLDDSLELLRHLLRDQITVVRRLGAVGKIQGHAGQINQIFMNLMTNAAQAIAGRDDATLTVTSEADDAQVIVRIADNGPGIPAAILPRIWDPFFTTKDVGEGTGLGLSIVHQLVERHGGTIEVQTATAQTAAAGAPTGTAFVVTLPRDARPVMAAKPAVTG
ncbi:MAG: HAMP domain-containing protein [Myxococcales bacterium]|nr:HAMP domain-containing protein [Myxococcales bacterium]